MADELGRIRVNLKLDPDTHSELKEYATEQGYTVQGCLNQMIKSMIEKNREDKEKASERKGRGTPARAAH